MAKLRDAFAAAHGHLRTNLRDGAFGPGAPLVVTDLAAILKLSSTPVREALCYLAGAGLIQRRPGGGYLSHSLGVSDLEDLYGLHEALVLAALEAARVAGLTYPQSLWRDELVQRSDVGAVQRAEAERVFTALVHLGQNRAIIDCYAQVADRLASIRLAETSVLHDDGRDVSDIVERLVRAQWADLEQGVRNYHDRRRRAAKSILLALQEA